MAVVRREVAENKLQSDLDELYKKGALIVAVVPSELKIDRTDIHYTNVQAYRIYYVPADQR